MKFQIMLAIITEISQKKRKEPFKVLKSKGREGCGTKKSQHSIK